MIRTAPILDFLIKILTVVEVHYYVKLIVCPGGSSFTGLCFSNCSSNWCTKTQAFSVVISKLSLRWAQIFE